MWSYIVKRLLLMVPTLFGIVLITFLILQLVPGGPVEQMLSQLQAHTRGGEAGAVAVTAGNAQRSVALEAEQRVMAAASIETIASGGASENVMPRTTVDDTDPVVAARAQ